MSARENMEVGGRRESQGADGRAMDGRSLMGRSEGQLVGASVGRSDGRLSRSPTRSDVISRTTLPGYHSGMAINASRQGENGETFWMVVKGGSNEGMLTIEK